MSESHQRGRSSLVTSVKLVAGVLACTLGLLTSLAGISVLTGGREGRIQRLIERETVAALMNMKESRFGQLSLSCPKNWSDVPLESRFLMNRICCKGLLNCSVVCEPLSAETGTDLDAVVATTLYQVQHLKIPGTTITGIPENERLTLNGLPIHRIVIDSTCDDDSSVPLRQVLLITTIGSNTYFVACTAVAGATHSAERIAQEMLASMRPDSRSEHGNACVGECNLPSWSVASVVDMATISQ